MVKTREAGVGRMEFTLERLIGDIKNEKTLWVSETNEDSEKVQATWDRVAAKNKLTGTEAKSIFKVLCKKYRQEAGKPSSNWKLFTHLKFLDEEKPEAKGSTEVTESPQPTPSIIEEETYVELLEVKDEDFSDDEYSRSFDGVKSDVEECDDKEQKPPEFVKAVTEPEKKEPVRQEETVEKVTTPPLDVNTEKKPVLNANLNLKRKVLDPKDGCNVPEKRPTFYSRVVQNKLIPNGVIKQNVETETESDQKMKFSKYSNFGQYVESTLNRLSPRLAAKLEIKILQSIIEVSSEMMDRLD